MRVDRHDDAVQAALDAARSRDLHVILRFQELIERRLVVADGGVERRTVRLGALSAAGQVVLAGLTAGTRLARGDLESLTDGSRVRVEE